MYKEGATFQFCEPASSVPTCIAKNNIKGMISNEKYWTDPTTCRQTTLFINAPGRHSSYHLQQPKHPSELKSL